MKKVYLAGPMRGYRYYNLEAFEAAKRDLEAQGREAGFDARTIRDPDNYDWTRFPITLDTMEAVQRCCEAVLVSDAVHLLPGWKNSTGAQAEVALAKFAGKEIVEIQPKRLKLFVIGPGEHGKDTVTEILAQMLGLSWESSSRFVAEAVVRPFLAEMGIRYPTLEACYEDRRNHRDLWRKAIEEFNAEDPQRLSKLIFGEYDIYTGIRSRREFIASREMADLSLWVDAGDRVTKRDTSLDILRSDADVVIDNSGAESDLPRKISRLFGVIHDSG